MTTKNPYQDKKFASHAHKCLMTEFVSCEKLVFFQTVGDGK